VAVRVAKANARKNRVERRITIVRQDLTRLPRYSTVRYDLICANLVWDLLINQRERILHRLAPGGSLVLAGILKSQFERVAEAYVTAGLERQTVTTEDEWTSGAFLQPK
jgi:ribosomal protein L11 methyltransferase